jgi:hypothetical protein
MLTCCEYEVTELALACHLAYGRADVPFFILQNCRGNYDAERTLEVARRYGRLFPQTIRVIERLPPGAAYHSINALLCSEEMRGFDLICKVDDDAFPIASGWLDALIDCWTRSNEEWGERLAYVTPLINNNCWGFPEVLRLMGLTDEYFSNQARHHLIGKPPRIAGPEVIDTGANGTIWGSPHVARWLHERTTLRPDAFISATRQQGPAYVPAEQRYSIGCILFRREVWSRIDDGGRDDEHMWHMYCASRNMRIICQRSVPFVHMAYFCQREDNRDLVEAARAVYERRLGLPFPVASRLSPLLEIEARLRWMEGQGLGGRSFGNAARKPTMKWSRKRAMAALTRFAANFSMSRKR